MNKIIWTVMELGLGRRMRSPEKPLPQMPSLPTEFRCITCGETKKESSFYKNNQSLIWRATYSHPLICKDCISGLFLAMTNKYDEEIAIQICCHYLDIPFSKARSKRAIESTSGNVFANYVKYHGNISPNSKSFADTLGVKTEFGLTDQDIVATQEKKWTAEQRRNKNFCLQAIGYDPFEDDNVPDSDKKFLYNTLSGYLDNDSIQEDSHKVQSIILIVNSLLQCKKIDLAINSEQLKSSPDSMTIKNLTATKKQLQDSIDKLAQSNNISSNYSMTAKAGRNTISGKMKEIAEAGFDQIKPNLYDVKTSEAMQMVANISNHSIVTELGFADNDWAQMVKEQREKLTALYARCDELEEEKRNLSNQLSNLGKKR